MVTATFCRLEIGDTAGSKPNATNFLGCKAAGFNPEGIAPLSAQGCEERATLGVLVIQSSTLQGLYQLLSMNRHAPIYGAEEGQDEPAATLSGLMGSLFRVPRVARSSQPWAD